MVITIHLITQVKNFEFTLYPSIHLPPNNISIFLNYIPNSSSIAATLVQVINISHLDYAIDSLLVMRLCHSFRITDFAEKEKKVNLTWCTFNETILLWKWPPCFFLFSFSVFSSFYVYLPPFFQLLSFSLPPLNFLFLYSSPYCFTKHNLVGR